MATTVVNNASLLNPLRVQEKLIAFYAERNNPLTPYIGTTSNNIIQRITDLEKKVGDTIRFHIRAKLMSEGIDSDNTLEGNESPMTFYHDSILIDQKRNAIRLDGQMTEQRSAIRLREEAGPTLGTWGAEWSLENMIFHLAGARGVRTGHILPLTYTGWAGNTLLTPSPNRHLIGTGVAKNALTLADHKMSTAILDKAKRNIDLLINTGAPMRPIMVDGKKTFLCLISPEQMYDLRQDDDWQAAQQEANVRGNSNPLFSGAEGMWDGLVVKVVPELPIFSDYGAGQNVNAARALILGAQALGVAYGNAGGTDAGEGRWSYREKAFDYDNQVGFSVRTIVGFKKIRFNSEDYGVYAVDTAYSA